MKSRWRDDEAEAMVTRYAQQGIGRDLALRVYTSRLLGQDPLLVLHGGGNTSVKTRAEDLSGEEVDVLCVKGSGWDMGDIEPAGLPAVRMKPLMKLRERDRLSDEDMVRYQRANLLDPGAPNPSVETLLHAFLPQKYVDHTHSTAVLSVADQPNAANLCAEIYGRRMGIVPYIMPGFDLAKKAAEVYEADPSVEGLVLIKHGIFTFGATAREAYERMIDMVTRAEERLAKDRKPVFATVALPVKLAAVSEIAPILRGACSLKDTKNDGAWRRLVLDFRSSLPILNYVNGAELKRYSQQGVVTPDHTIRTKNMPLQGGGTTSGRLVRRRLSRLLQAQQCRPRPGEARARFVAACGARAGPRPLRPRPQQEGRRRCCRYRREHGNDNYRCRGARALRGLK
jgi:rhamnose utilization protein RhaD (predicted bifunctional aldolase and dehydrogenase)